MLQNQIRLSVLSELRICYKTTARWKKENTNDFFSLLTAKMTLFLAIKYSVSKFQTKIDPRNYTVTFKFQLTTRNFNLQLNTST